MNHLTTFAAGLAATALLACGTAWYMKPHLQAILADLCGTQARANFWMAFSSIGFVAVPIIFALGAFPDAAGVDSPAFQLIQQLKWGVIGLIATVGAVGMALWSFIRRGPRPVIELPAYHQPTGEAGGGYEQRS